MTSSVFAKSTVSSQVFLLFPLPSPDLSQSRPQIASGFVVMGDMDGQLKVAGHPIFDIVL
jgi:hypothetical protein